MTIKREGHLIPEKIQNRKDFQKKFAIHRESRVKFSLKVRKRRFLLQFQQVLMKDTTGVILLNLGGPATLSEVRPFLYRLFSDRSLIRLGPRFLQRFLAALLARKRAPYSCSLYEQIGGGSPLVPLTQDQAAALQQLLNSASSETSFTVTCAMRYCSPTADEAVAYLREKGASRIIALPLYPHFNRGTSGSSLTDLRRALTASNTDIPLTEIHGWPTQPHYIKYLADSVSRELRISDKTNGNTAILYSAHNFPKSFIDEGDPYLEQLNSTIAELEKITGRRGTCCFQSKSGPVKWLSPTTEETIRDLAGKGCQQILIVPISFVSDHLETLYEIDIYYKRIAEDCGISCRSCPPPNTDPLFIQALATLVHSSS